MKFNRLEEEALESFAAEAKIGLIATVNPEGLPHVTFISSIRAKTPTQLMWGQFTEGLSKKHVKENPRTGFLVLTADKKMWRGKALWTHESKEGEDHEMYNKMPMFRYNAYLGIHTVHYMDLVKTGRREGLPMTNIVLGALVTRLVGPGARSCLSEPILKPWAKAVFSSINSLKFLCHTGEDGFPVLIPVIQSVAPDSRRLVFSPLAYRHEISSLTPGEKVALFALTMGMENVLVRGTFQGFKRVRGVGLGRVDIEWVYNSMPPKQGQIYPEIPLLPVTEFRT